MTNLISGLAAPLPLANADTDVIMPKRFLITITREGLAEGPFADLRIDEYGNIRPDFVLNRSPWDRATILFVGENFGCGSSREHAVWGLRQLGITACIGTGFAGIFFDNARKNGLALPIVASDVRDLLLQIASNPDGAEITNDIKSRTIIANDETMTFQMDDATRSALVRGGEDTLDTLKYADAIQAFEASLTDQMWVKVQK